VPIVDEVTPDHCRTLGKCLIHLKGRNFGHEQGTHIRVSIDGNLCADIGRGTQPMWISHFEMECVVPAGIGKNLDVSVEVSDQKSLRNELFHYDPASVFAIRPNHGFVKGGDKLTFIGENFGERDAMLAKVIRRREQQEEAKKNGVKLTEIQKLEIESPADLLHVSFGGSPCEEVVYVSDTEITCVTSPGSGGDLIPRVEVDLQVNIPDSIFSYRKEENLLFDSDSATKEAKKKI
jgi:hypothetical protein